MNIGEISKPFVMMDQTKNREVVAIVKLRSKTNAHKANLVDDYQTIRAMLEEKLGEETIKKWLQKKQQETYVHIHPEWAGCDFEYPGWNKD